MMPGLTVFVVAGDDARTVSSTVRAARAFFKGIDLEEVTRHIHPALGPVPGDAVLIGCIVRRRLVGGVPEAHHRSGCCSSNRATASPETWRGLRG
jgi:hypothetical protein